MCILSLIYLPPYECWKDQQTPVCQSAISEESKEMSMEDLFSVSCWTCIFSCLPGTGLGKAENSLSSAMNDHGVQRYCMAIRRTDCSIAREGPSTEVLFILSPHGCEVRQLAEEISLQQVSLPALPLPACDPTRVLLGHPSHFAETCDFKFHVDDKSNIWKSQ